MELEKYEIQQPTEDLFQQLFFLVSSRDEVFLILICSQRRKYLP